MDRLLQGISSSATETCHLTARNLKMLVLIGIPQSTDFNGAVDLLSCRLGRQPGEHCYLGVDY